MGVTALELGWLDADGLTRAMVLFRTGSYSDPRQVWLDSGLLTPEQTDSLYQRTGVRLSSSDIVTATDEGQAGEPHPDGERYVVEQTLSQGGMGRILVCFDRVIGRRVALKALRYELQAPEHANLLAREARVTGKLEHPSIVPVYDAGVSGREGPFYVMRLVDQPSLEHVLSGLRHKDLELTATWSLSRLLRTFVQVCQAVHYAHTRDVIHCDLKPDNILLGAFGEVLVGDWGLAYAREEGVFTRGGTPAYMAPEQIEGTDIYDARTDVFALGVVLYRILALRPPFAGSGKTEVLQGRTQDNPPPLPSSVAPRDRPVPAELEEIAMQAMDPDPTKRYDSAQALASAVDAFLEGTRDHEQRQRRADALVAQGDELAARYHEASDEWSKLATELGQLSLLIDPWAPLEERRRVWDAEDLVATTDALQVRLLREAIGSYEQALVEAPGHVSARRGLARLYSDQVERARERRSDRDRTYFENLLREYDDEGILVRAGGRPGWLNVEMIGDVEKICLAPIEERERQLVPGTERRLRRRALEAVPAAPGHYLLQLEAAGRRLLVPVVVRGDRETKVSLDLDASGLPRDDETFVAGGPAALGYEVPGAVQRELPDVIVSPFFIQTFPVTFGQYLEFLATMLVQDPRDVGQLIPCARDGVQLWTVQHGRLVPTDAHADLGMTDTWPRTPVFGVDVLSVIRYAEWWSARTGSVYRIPTEQEWEKAARGIDGRRFPWGDRFEALFCKMRFSRAGRPFPEPIGAFGSDVSPFGVRDLAGGIADLCTPVATEDHRTDPNLVFASRGGAWCDSDADCVSTARRRVSMGERSPRLGFRLVRDVSSPAR